MAVTFQRVGPHILDNTADAVNWARRGVIVKSLDNTYALQQAPQGTITVFRHYFPVQDWNRNGGDAANEVLAALGGYVPSCVEGYNEPVWADGDTAFIDRMIQFYREFCAVMHAAGHRVAGFSFSTGTPAGDAATEAAAWQQIQAGNFGDCDFIAVHEYWGSQGFTEWHALRHRRASAFLGGVHPAFLITECGRDAVEGGARGWKASGISAAQYVQELQQYDGLLAQDVYVGGGAVFTAGVQPGSEWDSFNTDGEVSAIVLGGSTSTDYYQRAREQLAAASQDPSWLTRPNMDVYNKLASDCTLFTGNNDIRLWVTGTVACPTPAPGSAGFGYNEACARARAVMADLYTPPGHLTAPWLVASCDAIRQEICQDNCTIFVGNDPHRLAICGTAICPAPMVGIASLSLALTTPNTQVFGQQTCVFVTARDGSGNPVPNAAVTIRVRSDHPLTTDAQGQASICWTRTLADGVTSDTAVAIAGGVTSNVVDIQWIEGQPGGQDNTALIIAGLIGLVGVGAVIAAVAKSQEAK